jgi:glucose/arabinose dehydrogenase
MIRFAALTIALMLTSVGASCLHPKVIIPARGVSATAMTFAPDGSIFVAEKRGVIREYSPSGEGHDVARVPVDTRSESGLVGIALDPAWPATPYIYIHYRRPDAHAIVSRFTYEGGVIGGEEQLIDFGTTNLIHIGGSLHFGPDGKLYIARGESKRRNGLAQSTVFLEGKILRINADGTIPPDNPFGNAIWALGFRNPFTFAFAADGRLYVNDVGENSYEEVNAVERGKNYGWPVCEGVCAYPYQQPIFTYAHELGGSAIAGGVVWNGSYYFADFLGGWIKRLNDDGTATTVVDDATAPVDLDVGPDGQLYYLSLTGAISRLDP